MLWILREPNKTTILPESTLQPVSSNPETKNTKAVKEWTYLIKKRWDQMPTIQGKTGLVLKSLLLIHEKISDANPLEGYEGLPLQVEQIYWEIWDLIDEHQDLETPAEVLEQWMTQCTPGDFYL
ncbi:MAG: hypothetical protein EBR69_02610 [Synechococcaceae bacterium WB4_2_0805]|nr:hypothetical protein [Synechococcaceae bacterium WB4_2_0805]